MQIEKHFNTVLALAVVLVPLLVLPGIATLTNNTIIPSTGTIARTTLAKSGSASDIQAAVNTISAAGGGTVYIPAGNWTWNNQTVTISGGVNVIGASAAGCAGHTANWQNYTASTILHNTAKIPYETMFHVDGSNGKASRISGIQFEATGPKNITAENIGAGYAVFLGNCINARVDHCTFINFCSVAVELANTNTGTASAVIDHCVVDNPYKLSGSGWSWGYGFYAQGEYPNWDTNITHFLGKYPVSSAAPTLYIEDNHFSLCRHATDCIQEGWDVVRFNLIDKPYPQNFGMVDIHGSNGAWTSGRGVEVYNNTIVGAGSNSEVIWIRGGGGTIFNNTIQNAGIGIGLYNDDPNNVYPNEHVRSLYIWSNSYTSVGTQVVNHVGYVQDVDYFLRAPRQSQDGFTYNPYTYPHPLTTG